VNVPDPSTGVARGVPSLFLRDAKIVCSPSARFSRVNDVVPNVSTTAPSRVSSQLPSPVTLASPMASAFRVKSWSLTMTSWVPPSSSEPERRTQAQSRYAYHAQALMARYGSQNPVIAAELETDGHRSC